MAKNTELDTEHFIYIKDARMHNLKGVDLAIPRNKLVVITGLSGSGKSSLAFDTLYAEGQRRYVESLSSYARQFLGRLEKPKVESIKGISPAIAIQQKVSSKNTRSTVGTTTEIYDYLKLLFARVGKTISPISGKEVSRDTVSSIVHNILSWEEGTKVMLTSPLIERENLNFEQRKKLLLQQGFSRFVLNGDICSIEDADEKNAPNYELLIDRFVIKHDDEDNESRIADSIETAYYEGEQECFVWKVVKSKERFEFSNAFALDGITFEKPSLHFFSFNNPLGACKRCEGIGTTIGIDEDLVIPNKSISVYEGAIACWKGEKMSKWRDDFVNAAHHVDFPVHKPIEELSDKEYQMLWSGNAHVEGLDSFFEYLESKSYKIQYRVMLSRYRGKTKCPECKGTRLRKDANYVKVEGTSITDIVLQSVDKSLNFFKNLTLSEHDEKVAKRILVEINNRLQYLSDVGLGYLTLNRHSATLSGGESQRIHLATSLGSSLVGSMYILDEPSIGLHPRDTKRLVGVLRHLQEQGNTVIVVEHEEEVMKAADHIIDMGPEAGSLGGEVVFEGTMDALVQDGNSLTGKYLSQSLDIPLPEKRREPKHFIKVLEAHENNLKGIDVSIPLDCLTVVTGVSGSGKSTLINKIFYPALKRTLGDYGDIPGKHKGLTGETQRVGHVEFIDQNPIGKSSRSNPVTYIKAYDDIRQLYAKQQLSKSNGYKPSHFSFNVAGGRCEVCKGEGFTTVEMQFMPDISLKCEACEGKRFQDEILEVRYKRKSIYDILQMTIDDAIAFFKEDTENSIAKKITEKLQPLQDVGLGYVQLGQSSNTLSGGEAQRIKLASFLGKGMSSDNKQRTLFVFDEPTTGLHFHDISKLMRAFYDLIALGHSIVVIEHNTEVIKCADWLIDLGPEGGDAGGNLVYEGAPLGLLEIEHSYTAQYLRGKLVPTAST